MIYADDLVILCKRGKAEEALAYLHAIMRKLKLEVNAEKTWICKMPGGTFDFLGYTFGRAYSSKTGKARLGYWPSKKSIRRMVEKIHALTERSKSWQETTELVDKLNSVLRGWANYFAVGTVQKAYRALDTYAALRLRRWLRCKHKVRRRRGGSYPLSHLYGHCGPVRLRLKYDGPWAESYASSESRCGKPPVGFYERGVELGFTAVIRHRQTKGAETDMSSLQPPRHIST